MDLRAEAEIQEYVAHSWYDYQEGKDKGLHPWDGETKLDYEGRGGPQPPYQQLNVDDGYSWLKSPRWNGQGDGGRSVGAGAGALRQGRMRRLANWSIRPWRASTPTPRALFSTLGRTAARTLETKLIADQMQDWYDTLIANIRAGNTQTFNDGPLGPVDWPREAKGVGFTEAPAWRPGALRRRSRMG